MHVNDAIRAVAELAASQHGVVTSDQAASLGLSPRQIRYRVRTGQLDEPAPGVLVIPGAPATWHRQLAIALHAAGSAGLAGTAAVSHRSAARLHALDGFTDAAAVLGEPVEVTVLRGRRPRVPSEAHVHQADRLDRCDLTVVDGFRCTSLARTLADLGASASSLEVRTALDDAFRRGASRRWIEWTLGRVDRPGPSGTATLRRLLDEVAVLGNESWFERLVAEALMHPDLPEPVLQHEVRDPAGRVIARIDLAYPLDRVGLEAHSARFHNGVWVEGRDIDRDNELAVLGWELAYVRFALAVRPVALRDFVRRLLAARRPDLAGDGRLGRTG